MYKKWHFYASKEACFNSPQLLHFWKPLQWIPFFEGYPSEEEGGWGFLWGLQIRFQSLGLTRSALAKKFLLKAKSFNFDDDGWSGKNDSWWVVFPHKVSNLLKHCEAISVHYYLRSPRAEKWSKNHNAEIAPSEARWQSISLKLKDTVIVLRIIS